MTGRPSPGGEFVRAGDRVRSCRRLGSFGAPTLFAGWAPPTIPNILLLNETRRWAVPALRSGRRPVGSFGAGVEFVLARCRVRSGAGGRVRFGAAPSSFATAGGFVRRRGSCLFGRG